LNSGFLLLPSADKANNTNESPKINKRHKELDPSHKNSPKLGPINNGFGRRSTPTTPPPKLVVVHLRGIITIVTWRGSSD